MLARIACFTLGVLFFQQLSDLPSLLWLLLLLPCGLWAWFLPRIRLSFFLLLGFCWALFRADLILQHALPAHVEGQDLLIEGVIDSIPERQGRSTRFNFQVTSGRLEDAPVAGLGLIRLSWYSREAHVLEVGQRWQLPVRLKQPNGFQNPGGFDYEQWLFQQGIRATGYVKSGKKAKPKQLLLAESESHWVDRIRSEIQSRLQHSLPESQYVGVMSALAIGLRQQIDQDQWQVLTRTGTNHLMAISGLHIGLVAGMVFLLVGRLWRLSASACLWFPARKAGAIAAIVAALIYAALAGFSVPTQRALVMLVVALGALLLQRALPVRVILAWAWLAVLLMDPFALMSVGFWLSFVAVMVIVYTMSGRSNSRSWWWRWGRVHWVITLGLLPLLLLFFQQAPLYSFLANGVAVPVVGLLVVPMVLVATLLLYLWPAVAMLLLTIVDGLFHYLWLWLEWVANLQGAQWVQHQPAGWALACGAIGMVLLLAPRGWPGRWVGVVWLMPMVLVKPPHPEMGDYWLTLLDVGQGTAVVVATQNHRLIYDVGPAFSSRFDAGDRVVVPYLRYQGVALVDKLVLSHDDIDHTGGAEALLSSIEVAEVMSPNIPRFVSERHNSCRGGDGWQWDGVDFLFLHPEEVDEIASDNNRSCVLSISSPGGRVLLTGDIERVVEHALVDQLGEALQHEILLAPHHGSNSSSSMAFIQAVSPDYGLISAGYRNRYGFPREQVVDRYQSQQVTLLNTVDHGAIRFKILAEKGILAPEFYRDDARRFWHRH